jgi:hypothetical protein
MTSDPSPPGADTRVRREARQALRFPEAHEYCDASIHSASPSTDSVARLSCVCHLCQVAADEAGALFFPGCLRFAPLAHRNAPGSAQCPAAANSVRRVPSRRSPARSQNTNLALAPARRALFIRARVGRHEPCSAGRRPPAARRARVLRCDGRPRPRSAEHLTRW